MLTEYLTCFSSISEREQVCVDDDCGARGPGEAVVDASHRRVLET